MKPIEFTKSKDPIHGFIYQLKLLMLFLHRGVQLEYSFLLRTELKEAGSFDDLIFEYTEDKNTFFRLLQAKHSLHQKEKITAAKLLEDSTKEQKYSLIKYCCSYMKIKKQKSFSRGSFKDLILCTNADFDMEDLGKNGIDIYRDDEVDKILNICTCDGEVKPTLYRLSVKFADELKKHIDKESQDAEIAKIFVEFILGNKPFHKKYFGIYSNALAYEVVDKSSNKLFDNFVSNKDISSRASEFRVLVESEVIKQSKGKLDLNKLNDELKKGTYELNAKNFGRYPEPHWPPSEVSKDDVINFLNLLRFAVNINEDELGKAISKEISNQFNKITSEHVYGNLFLSMTDFLQDKQEEDGEKIKFWSFQKGQNLIKNARFAIIDLQLSGYRNHLDSIKFSFKETLFDKLLVFINSKSPLWLLTSETPYLSALAVYQSINNNMHTWRLFIFKWSDLLDNNGEIFLDFRNLDNFFIIISCLQMIGTEAVTADLVKKIEALISMQRDSNSKKILVVASELHEIYHQLLKSDLLEFYREELNIGFCDMDDNSQKLLLEIENITFQGNRRMSLRNLLHIKDHEWQKQVEMLNLETSDVDLLLRSSEIEIFNQMQDFKPFISTINKPINFDNIIKEMKMNKNDIFAFYGDNGEIKKMFHNQGIDLLKFNVKDSLDKIMKHGIVLLELEKESVEFNILCKLVYDCACNNIPAVHKVKYCGNNRWMWMTTFWVDFYINRNFKSYFVSIRLLNILFQKNFSDFIVFSGLEKEELLNYSIEYYDKKNIKLDKTTFVNNCYIAKCRTDARRKFNNLSKILKETSSYNPNDTYLTATVLYDKRAVHWIKVQGTNGVSRNVKFEWEKSVGNMTTLCNVLKYNENDLNEENLIDLNKRLVLLAGEPGTGKSSTLSQLVQNLNKCKPSLLVLKIDFSELQRSSESLFVKSKNQLIELLFRVLKKSSTFAIERKILEYKMECPEQLVLMFDGLNEVFVEKYEDALNLINFIYENTKANLWITTHNQNKVESSLNVLSYSFVKLNSEDQISYLFKCLAVSFIFSGKYPSLPLQFKSIITDHFESTFSNFSAVPLMLRFFVEMYMDVLIDNITLDNDAMEKKICEINVEDAFESFIHHRYEIYFLEKVKIVECFDTESKSILIDAYSYAYSCLAAKLMENSFREQKIFVAYEGIEKNFYDSMRGKVSLVTLSRIGLVEICEKKNQSRITMQSSKANDFQINSNNLSPFDNGTVKFIHPLLMEIFAVKFICFQLKTFPSIKILWKFLIDKILCKAFTLKIFDSKLAKDNELANLSSNDDQKEIIFQLHIERSCQSKIPMALWRAAEEGLKNTIIFLSKCFLVPNYFPVAREKIFRGFRSEFFRNGGVLDEEQLVNYIMEFYDKTNYLNVLKSAFH